MSLSELLGVKTKEESKQQKNKQEEVKEQTVSLNYLNALKNAVGAEKALEIVQKYSPDDIIKMEKVLDTFKFPDMNDQPNDKLEKILQCLEWDEQLEDFDDRTYSIEHVALTYDEFKKINKIIIKNKENKNRYVWSSFRAITSELLQKYGVLVTQENSNFHIGMKYGEIRAIPGVTTEKLINFIFTKSKEGKPINEQNIVGGFNDPFAALEAASIRTSDSGRLDADLLVKLGFKTLEQVKEVDAEKIRQLEEIYDFRGELCSDTRNEINFKRFVGTKIKGSMKKVDEFLELSTNLNALEYLLAFNGSIEQVKRIYKIPESQRPDAKSIRYVRNKFFTEKNLPLPEFKEVIGIARKISGSPTAVYVKDFTTLDDFLKYRAEFEKVNNSYKEASGKEDLNSLNYDEIKDFKGDFRFFKHFGIYDLEKLEKISSKMTFEQYDSLKVPHWRKDEFILTLLEKGHSVDGLVERFNEDISHDSKRTFNMLYDEGVSLEDSLGIAKTGISCDYAQRFILKSGLIGTDFPYTLFPALKAANVDIEKFSAFMTMLGGLGKYKTESGFDGISMMKDYRELYGFLEKKSE